MIKRIRREELKLWGTDEEERAEVKGTGACWDHCSLAAALTAQQHTAHGGDYKVLLILVVLYIIQCDFSFPRISLSLMCIQNKLP